jgi:hypothetical protein
MSFCFFRRPIWATGHLFFVNMLIKRLIDPAHQKTIMLLFQPAVSWHGREYGAMSITIKEAQVGTDWLVVLNSYPVTFRTEFEALPLSIRSETASKHRMNCLFANDLKTTIRYVDAWRSASRRGRAAASSRGTAFISSGGNTRACL